MYAYALYGRGFQDAGWKVLRTLYRQCMDFEKSKVLPGIPEYFDDRGMGMYPYLTGSGSWLMLTLQTMIFGSYNKKVEHPRTTYDWLTRDSRIVDAYMAHPLCGFTASAGLLREMMKGIYYIEQKQNLAKMPKSLPVFFIAGGDDPVGPYGKGVHTCADAFRSAGMEDVSVRIYPLCRHEILNEINRSQVFEDILHWIEKQL